MTLISSIILDAYRESNIIPLAVTPNDAQNTESLRLYNAVLVSLFGADVGENLKDWPLGNFGRVDDADWPILNANDHWLRHPPINSRLIAVNDGPITIEFALQPQDGARYGILDPYGRLASAPITINGNSRTIGGQPSVTLNTNGLSQQWIYRADIGDWVVLAPKLLTDDNPFPPDFDQMFAILLAMRLNPRYGRDLSSLSESVFKAARTAFLARYINSEPLVRDDTISWPFMSRMGWWWGRSFTSSTGFAQGRPYG